MADSGGPSSARMRIRKAGSNSMVLKAPVPHSIAHCLHAVEARKQSRGTGALEAEQQRRRRTATNMRAWMIF
jgi:hypothetical protein